MSRRDKWVLKRNNDMSQKTNLDSSTFIYNIHLNNLNLKINQKVEKHHSNRTKSEEILLKLVKRFKVLNTETA